MESSPRTPLPVGRQELAKLIRHAGDVIKVQDAAEILQLSALAASKKLARWTEQGWLRRVAYGVYTAAALDMLESEVVLDDPWILVPNLFDPAYIGGRTAAEYWDFTEQIFNDIVVLTNRFIRKKSQKHQGALFTLKHISHDKIFGLQTIWRRSTEVQISDIHKTIIDMLDDPAFAGGIQHVADCLNAYLKRPDRNDETLIAYGDQLGNGAVFKRLGFLVERNSLDKQLLTQCQIRLTQGNTKLDPSIKGDQRLIKRWHLFVSKSWLEGCNNDT